MAHFRMQQNLRHSDRFLLNSGPRGRLDAGFRDQTLCEGRGSCRGTQLGLLGKQRDGLWMNYAILVFRAFSIRLRMEGSELVRSFQHRTSLERTMHSTGVIFGRNLGS